MTTDATPYPAAIRGYAQLIRETDERARHLRAERDRLMVAAHRAGWHLQDLAGFAGMTTQAAGRRLRGQGVTPRPGGFQAKTLPPTR